MRCVGGATIVHIAFGLFLRCYIPTLLLPLLFEGRVVGRFAGSAFLYCFLDDV
jgi:hypothetical protein